MLERKALFAKFRVHPWLVAASVGIGAALLVIQSHGQPPRGAARAPLAEASEPKPDTEQPRAAKAPELDPEAALMTRLHALAERDPATALGLALRGNAQFPASADAPERGWIICRSLVQLKRFPEAVAEARVVLDQYPDTPWARDVERHLLINPMSDPSERGYGHVSELE